MRKYLAIAALLVTPAAGAVCIHVPLDVRSAERVEGFEYLVYMLPGSGVTPDSKIVNGAIEKVSPLRLFENGVEMGPAHSRHISIASVGKGAFLHWSVVIPPVVPHKYKTERLLFSARDNSDPRSNGKRYSYCVGADVVAEPDSEAPSVPVIKPETVFSASIDWSASTDNVRVSKYNVYRDDKLIDTRIGLRFTDTGLDPGTYVYTVAAVDAAGNTSAKSAGVSVTVGPTLVPPPVETPVSPSPTTEELNDVVK